MKEIIQLGVGMLCAIGTTVILFLLVISELNFMDLRFGVYFGILGIIAGVAFFVLTRKDDNEETNPVEEKVRR